MSRKNDHDIAHALLDELAGNDPLNDQTDRPLPVRTDTFGSRLLHSKLPDAQDISGSSSLAPKTSQVQDALSPKPLPPSDSFLPRSRHPAAPLPVVAKTSMDQDFSGSSSLPPQTPAEQGFFSDAEDPQERAGAPETDNRRPYLQPGRVGKHRVQRWIGPRAKRQIRLICVNHDITEQDFFGMAINMAFAHFGVPRLAFETDQDLTEKQPPQS